MCASVHVPRTGKRFAAAARCTVSRKRCAPPEREFDCGVARAERTSRIAPRLAAETLGRSRRRSGRSVGRSVVVRAPHSPPAAAAAAAAGAGPASPASVSPLAEPPQASAAGGAPAVETTKGAAGGFARNFVPLRSQDDRTDVPDPCWENVPGVGLESAAPSSQQQQNRQSAGGQRPHQQPRASADFSRKPVGKHRPSAETGKDGQCEAPTTKDQPPIFPAETPSTPSAPAAAQRELPRREQEQQQPPHQDVLLPTSSETAGGKEIGVGQETSRPSPQNSQRSRATVAKDGKAAMTKPPASQSVEVSNSTGSAVPAETKDVTPIEVWKHRPIEQKTQTCNAENGTEDRIGASLSIAQDTNQMVPLSEVEEELRSHGIDPLSLHMLKRTKSTGTGMLLPMQDSTQAHDSDDSDSDIDEASKRESDSGAGSHISGGAESDGNFTDLETPSELLGKALGYSYIKVKVRHKRNKQLGRLFLCQELAPPEDPSGADVTAAATT
ncbi:MAG: hypothetical protein BJ554DRAFT_3404, partial [Olpidium bornovanus]